MTLRRVAVALFAISCACAGAAALLGAHAIAARLALPALALSGWAFGGHLITLDDDWPGGFSNPKGDPKIWRSSVLELIAKLAVLVFLLLFFAWELGSGSAER